VLEEEGYVVLAAASGEEALRMAVSYDGTIELLLTDVVMSGINGRLVAERLAESRPDVAVIYMSGYTDDMVVRTGVVAAGATFLQKPFTGDALVDRVRAVLTSNGSDTHV
jgi:two-component system, cell cycle sensor histidine kinase and response regulator CckA